jgi:hypothetical protein
MLGNQKGNAMGLSERLSAMGVFLSSGLTHLMHQEHKPNNGKKPKPEETRQIQTFAGFEVDAARREQLKRFFDTPTSGLEEIDSGFNRRPSNNHSHSHWRQR